MPVPANSQRAHSHNLGAVLGWVCGIFTGCLVLLLLAVGWWSRSDALNAAEFVAANLSQAVENRLARTVEGADLLLHQQIDLAADTDWSDPGQVRQSDRRVSEMADRLPYVFRLFILGADGSVLASSMRGTPEINAADRQYFIAHREGDQGLLISPPLHSKASGEPIVVFSRRIADADGSFRGVAIVSFNLNTLEAFFSELPRQYDPILQIIGDDMEVLLTAPPPPPEVEPDVRDAARDLMRRQHREARTQTYEGEERVWAFHRVEPYGLFVRIGLSRDAVLNGWYLDSVAYFLFSALALGGLTLVSVVAVQRARNADRYRSELVAVNSDLESRVGERTRAVGEANERLRDVVERLREESRTLEAIGRINTSIASELEIDALVQTATDAATESSGAQFGAFFYNVRGAEGDGYSLYSLSGLPREAFARFPMPRATHLFGPVFRGEGIMRIGDVLQDPRYGRSPPYGGMPEGHPPVRSYLAAPVISRSGAVLGGLFFGHGEPHVFTERSERVVTAIAAQAAIALDKAQLYRAAQAEIASREVAEQALRESEARFRQLADSMPQIVWTARPDGRVDYYNRRWYEFTGREEGDLSRWHGVLHPDDVERTRIAWLESVRTGRLCEIEYRLRNRDGAFRWHLGRALAAHDGAGRIMHWFATCTDIDDRKRSEEELARHRDRLAAQALQLERALADKTVLFQEVHHRVKNNLQVICSLMRMQAKSVSDPVSRSALDDTYNRIYAISLVHEVLYAENEASELEIGPYLHRLCGILGGIYAADKARIEIEVEASGSLELVRAVPVGLLVNELLSNALEHAFPAGGPGEVLVKFRSDGHKELVVSDNGIGMPGVPDRPGSLGMTIIRALVAQLDGEMHRENAPGTTIRIVFPAE